MITEGSVKKFCEARGFTAIYVFKDARKNGFRVKVIFDIRQKPTKERLIRELKRCDVDVFTVDDVRTLIYSIENKVDKKLEKVIVDFVSLLEKHFSPIKVKTSIAVDARFFPSVVVNLYFKG